MQRTFHFSSILIIAFLVILTNNYGIAQTSNYLESVKIELQKKWPQNRTINLVFHGHSVPSGYFDTPNVHTIDAYPHLVLALLKEKYPYAVINCITTSIGGENSLSGEKRFKKDVLVLKPDVLFIDYALNDRKIGPDSSRKATERMIKAALRKNIKVILMCPSPDTGEDILNTGSVLQTFEKQIIGLANRYQIGVVDSYELFRKKARNGETINNYMAQSNHPNAKGHRLIAREIVSKYFSE